MREHHVKASMIRLDAIGVVMVPGQEPSLTQESAVRVVRAAGGRAIVEIFLPSGIVGS